MIWMYMKWRQKTDPFLEKWKYRNISGCRVFLLFACECPVIDAMWYIQLLNVKSLLRWKVSVVESPTVVSQMNAVWFVLTCGRFSATSLNSAPFPPPCAVVGVRSLFWSFDGQLPDRQVLMLHSAYCGREERMRAGRGRNGSCSTTAGCRILCELIGLIIMGHFVSFCKILWFLMSPVHPACC